MSDSSIAPEDSVPLQLNMGFGYKSQLKEKAFKFSFEVINLYNGIDRIYRFNPLWIQLIKSATSVGANIEEANAWQSNRDFLSKFYISYKEARETDYWLRLMRATNMLDKSTSDRLICMCSELCKMLYSSIRTAQNRQ